MSDKSQVLMADDPGRRKRPEGSLPPSSLRDLAPILVLGGVILSLAGWVDVALFYWPPHFGDSQWEFAVIAQTFDAFPLPTMGTLMLALALRAMPERRLLARLAAACCAAVALACLGLIILFALDIPVAFNALARAAQQAAARGEPANPVIGAGLKRVVAKAMLFGTAYAVAYATLTVALWRGARHQQAA